MENGHLLNRISPAEANLVIYEENGDNILANIGIVKKTFNAFDVNVRYRTVDDKWEDDLNNVAQKVVFVISSDNYVSKVKRKIASFREENNNMSTVTDVRALILHVTEDGEDDDGDNNNDDEFQFESDDDIDKDIIKVGDLNNVYKWWPYILLFLRSKKKQNESGINRRYGCFFIFNENSRKESEWYRRHRDALEKLGIQCLRREEGSHIHDDAYMQNSKCVIIYVNNNRSPERIEQTKKKAIENGCKIRLYLENANTDFAESIRERCNVTLTGSTLHAHLTGLMKDLDMSKSCTISLIIFIHQ